MEINQRQVPAAEYCPPAIVARGALNELTQGGSTGSYLDANFAAGTPRGSLTFS